MHLVVFLLIIYLFILKRERETVLGLEVFCPVSNWGEKMGGPSSECSSSGEEDGDAQWKSAIGSIAATSSFVTSNNDATPKPPVGSAYNDAQKLKHYQIKVHLT